MEDRNRSGTNEGNESSFCVQILTRTKLRSNRADELSNVTYLRYAKREAVHAMAELKIEPNPKKMRSAAILVNPAAHTKELVGMANGRPLTFSFHSAACSGRGLAFTALEPWWAGIEWSNRSQSADRHDLHPGFLIEEAQPRARPRPRFPTSRSQALSGSEVRKRPSYASPKEKIEI